MTVEHDHETAPAALGKRGETDSSEKRFREFIEFFGCLIGLVGFGLGILPNSTVTEKLLVVVTAIALSGVILLAIRLVLQGRTAAWLAVFGAVSVVRLAALSVVAQGTVTPAASAVGTGPAPHWSAMSSGASPASTTPAIQPAVTPQASSYSSDYTDHPFEMPGDACQYANAANASSVSSGTRDATGDCQYGSLAGTRTSIWLACPVRQCVVICCRSAGFRLA